MNNVGEINLEFNLSYVKPPQILKAINYNLSLFSLLLTQFNHRGYFLIYEITF